MKTLIVSTATAIAGAVVATLIVLAVDGGDTTVVQQLPTAGAAVATDAALPADSDRLPIAALEDEMDSGGAFEPEGAAAVVDSPFASFDPQRLFEIVSPSVVAIETQLGGGSGFFIDSAGHLATNYHVIQGASRITVVTADGDRVEATLLGFDRANDLAILQVDPNEVDITPIPLADSEAIRVGDPVAAIGNPFGLQTSLTTGVVSAIERVRPGLTLGGRPQRGLIQTDAAINPGNSGGVLVNARGEVIGITSSVESPVRGFVGVGFAVASDTLQRFLPDLLAGREVLHPWIGIQGGEADGQAGLLIGSVVPNGPADSDGLRPGDRLLTADGITLADFDQLALYLDGRDVSVAVEFTLDRNGRTLTITVALAAWPG